MHITDVVKNTLIVSLLFWVTTSLISCSEQFSKNADDLYRAIMNELIKNNFCTAIIDCSKKYHFYGENGDRIHLNLYDATDPTVIRTIFGFVSEKGLSVSNGVPITLRAYTKPKDYYLNKLSEIVSPSKPHLELRVEDDAVK